MRITLLGLSTSMALAGAASAGPLHFPPAPIPGGQPPVVLAQSADPTIAQLQEQIRNLTGRVEELGFQLLQMQEQMRQMQQDNEFRFQELEQGLNRTDAGPAAGAPRQETAAGDPVAEQITASTQPAASTPATATGNSSAEQAAPPRSLGTLSVDAEGNITGGSISDLPAVAADRPVQQDVASLGASDGAAAYDQAYQLMLGGNYAQAEQAFRTYIEQHPDSPLADDASFWLGESLYSQGSYTDAARTFLDAHQTYPESDKSPEMLLKLGMSLAALENTEMACATFDEVETRYPDAAATLKDKLASERAAANC